MFYIENFMKEIQNELPNIKIKVGIYDIGYRIAIENGTLSEKLDFLNKLHKQQDLYVVRVCDGTRYIIRVLVILKGIYINDKIHLLLPTSVQTMNNIPEDVKEKIEHYLNLNIEEI